MHDQGRELAGERLLISREVDGRRAASVHLIALLYPMWRHETFVQGCRAIDQFAWAFRALELRW